MTQIHRPFLILASTSPRRRELLAQLGIEFEVSPVDLDETPRANERPEQFVVRMAREKAEAGWEKQSGERGVLGADTCVVVNGRIFGKPKDRADAIAMLEALSDRSHEVLSAVAFCRGVSDVEISRSSVTFRQIAPWERAAYWSTGEPSDKAGGYAIQGLGAVFVARLEGSYSGVMGLPLYETARLLARNGIPVFRRPGAAGNI